MLIAPLKVVFPAEFVVSAHGPSIVWSKVAPQLDGRAAAIRRWLDGTKYEQAEVYSSGEAVGVEFGAPDEPVSFAISRLSVCGSRSSSSRRSVSRSAMRGGNVEHIAPASGEPEVAGPSRS